MMWGLQVNCATLYFLIWQITVSFVAMQKQMNATFWVCSNVTREETAFYLYIYHEVSTKTIYRREDLDGCLKNRNRSQFSIFLWIFSTVLVFIWWVVAQKTIPAALFDQKFSLYQNYFHNPNKPSSYLPFFDVQAVKLGRLPSSWIIGRSVAPVSRTDFSRSSNPPWQLWGTRCRYEQIYADNNNHHSLDVNRSNGRN